MVVAIAIPTLGLMPLVLPAVEYTMGTMVESPKPTNENPIKVVGVDWNKRAIDNPKMAKILSKIKSYLLPNLVVK